MSKFHVEQKLYVTMFRMQADEIKQYCFRQCGQALVGAILDPDFGELAPCKEEKCPYMERQMDEPIGTADGKSIYLRKLKPLK